MTKHISLPRRWYLGPGCPDQPLEEERVRHYMGARRLLMTAYRGCADAAGAAPRRCRCAVRWPCRRRPHQQVRILVACAARRPGNSFPCRPATTKSIRLPFETATVCWAPFRHFDFRVITHGRRRGAPPSMERSHRPGRTARQHVASRSEKWPASTDDVSNRRSHRRRMTTRVTKLGSMGRFLFSFGSGPLPSVRSWRKVHDGVPALGHLDIRKRNAQQ